MPTKEEFDEMSKKEQDDILFRLGRNIGKPRTSLAYFSYYTGIDLTGLDDEEW